MSDSGLQSCRDAALHISMIFAIAAAGCATAFTLWQHDIDGPQVAFLGSGNRLSVLVSEGPARVVLATGDDPVAYENALMSVQPLFARRVDVLLIAGSGRSLLVPVSAVRDPHVRSKMAISPLPVSDVSRELGIVPTFDGPRRLRIGTTVTLTIESVLPIGADSNEAFASWRVTIERGETRVVVLSDGPAAGLFPPGPAASVLAVSGEDPIDALAFESAASFVANAESIDGPAFREGLGALNRPPAWGFRIAPNDLLRLRLVDGGIEAPSGGAQEFQSSRATVALNRHDRSDRRIRRCARLLR